MKQRPMLFSAPMVRALLNGSKTQTRRVVKDQSQITQKVYWSAECPHGQRGDYLWVKESYRLAIVFDDKKPSEVPQYGMVGDVICGSRYFEADDVIYGESDFGKLRPSMFMCRWMSRITLDIIGVSVERLQDISEADAIAEGIEKVDGLWKNYTPGNGWTPRVSLAENSYRSLWCLINGEDSWDANPWVWVIQFRRI